MQRYGPLLASVSPAALLQVGRTLFELRSAVAADARNKLQALEDRFTASLPTDTANIPSTVPGAAAVQWAIDGASPALR
jgi:hypothetical protein